MYKNGYADKIVVGGAKIREMRESFAELMKRELVNKYQIPEEDIITEIDGVSIAGSDPQTLYDLVSGKKLGEQISLKIWNNNEIKSVIITIE